MTAPQHIEAPAGSESRLKITDVVLTLFRWPGIPPTSYNQHTGQFSGESQLGLLALRTDEEIVGHAFLGSSMYSADQDGLSLVKNLKPLLLDQDPLDRAFLYDRISHRKRFTTLRAIGAVDVALWDIAGKAAGLPVYKLIGGYRDRVPAYASSAVLPSKEAYAEEAAAYKTAGWAAYKIHPPTRWREDIEVCETVREAVGPDYTLMLDSTWSYTYEHALRVGRAAEALGFYWYEDPLEDDDIYNCIKLREKLDIPLLATEYSPGGFTSYAPWILNRATDYLRGDVAVKGGNHGVDQDRAPRGGLRDELRDPPRRQLAQQLGEPERDPRDQELPVLRGAAPPRGAEIRRRRGPRA